MTTRGRHVTRVCSGEADAGCLPYGCVARGALLARGSVPATDAYLPPAPWACGGQVFAGAVVVIYNHPSLARLVLSRALVNAIFVATQDSWSATQGSWTRGQHAFDRTGQMGPTGLVADNHGRAFLSNGSTRSESVDLVDHGCVCVCLEAASEPRPGGGGGGASRDAPEIQGQATAPMDKLAIVRIVRRSVTTPSLGVTSFFDPLPSESHQSRPLRAMS